MGRDEPPGENNGSPYSRTAYIFEHGVWRRLERLGDTGIAKTAQNWILPVASRRFHSAHTRDRRRQPEASCFYVIDGYGVTGQSQIMENLEFPPGMPQPSLNATSVAPELMRTWMHCTLFDPWMVGLRERDLGAKSSGGKSKSLSVFGWGGGSDEIFSSRTPLCQLRYSKGGPGTGAFSKALMMWGEPEASLNERLTPKEREAAAERVTLRRVADATEVDAEDQESAIPVLWASPGAAGKSSTCMDTYRGPVSKDLRAELERCGPGLKLHEGQLLRTASYRGGISFAPRARGPLFACADGGGAAKELAMSATPRIHSVMERRMDRCEAEDAPRAAAHAARLATDPSLKPPPEVASMTVTVAVLVARRSRTPTG